MIQMNLQNRKRLTDLENKLMDSKRGRMGGKGSQRVWDGHVYTVIFKMDNQQGSTV